MTARAAAGEPYDLAPRIMRVGTALHVAQLLQRVDEDAEAEEQLRRQLESRGPSD
jgi:hypothetical protein